VLLVEGQHSLRSGRTEPGADPARPFDSLVTVGKERPVELAVVRVWADSLASHALLSRHSSVVRAESIVPTSMRGTLTSKANGYEHASA